MHELAVCQDIITQVERIALDNHARLVVVIRLKVGPLSGVEIPLLKSAFTIARAGTVANDAELFVEPTDIRVKCKICCAESVVAQNKLICSRCGDWQTTLISGDEMILQQVELTEGD